MKPQRVLWGLGGITVFFAASFAVPAIIALLYDPAAGNVRMRAFDLGWFQIVVPETALVFLLIGCVTAIVGLTMQYLGAGDDELRNREAYAIVGIGWLLIAAIGAVPYLALGALPNPVDAFFESMSGFTTTGATVLPGSLERYPPSLMMWRAFEQWVGGMGIIVLTIAVLAGLTQGGHQLMAAETPGLKMERLRPKIKQTAQLLWSIYFAYSIILFGLLVPIIHFTGVKLPLPAAFYEALLHTFTTMPTGGFSNHDNSIAYFDSIWFDIVVTVSMFAAGLNFTLHYAMWHDRSPRRLLADPEARFYAGVTVLTALFVAAVLVWKTDEAAGGPWGIADAVRAGFVQTVAIITTTGFTAYAFDQWPDAARLVLLFMFFTGGSAGSTTGALKMVRILVLFKLVVRELRKLLHPRAVIPLRLGKTVLNDDTIKTVAVFFFTYISLFILGTILLTLMDLDLVSAISASASAIGNIGPGLGTVHLSYADVPDVGKVLLALLMWFGRLEIFTTLVLFAPTTWRR